MEPLLRLGLTNALMATVLAVLAAGVSVFCRRPAVLHCLWLLVLLKLITPPLLDLPISWPRDPEPAVLKPAPKAAAPLPGLLAAPAQEVAPLREAKPPENLEEEAILARPLPLIPIEQDLRRVTEPPAEDKNDSETATLADAEPAEVRATFLPISWPWIVGGIWLTGTVWWSVLTVMRIGRFHALLRCAQPAPFAVCELTRQLAKCLGLRHCPTVWLMPGRLPPLLWALDRRPRLLLPADLWRRLDDDQRATLLVHELAHLRRGDAWVRVLEFVVTGLFWWHPVVWWARRELHEAEEQCCDAWVVWVLPGAARAYATALVETVDFLSEMQTALPLVASGLNPIQDLRRRLTMIMRGTTPRALSSAGFLAMLGLGALLLPMMPSWAQRPNEPADPGRRNDEHRRDDPNQGSRGGDDNRRFGEGSGGNDLDSARRDVERMRANVEQMQRQLKEAMTRLDDAQRRLNERANAEQDRRRRDESGRPANRAGDARAAGERGSGRDDNSPERRLREVERKLDMVLEEVRSLRRELQPGQGGRGGRAGFGRGTPGGGGAGGRPGQPGGGGTGPGPFPGGPPGNSNPPRPDGPPGEGVGPTPPAAGAAPFPADRPTTPPTPAGGAAPGAAPAPPSRPDNPPVPATPPSDELRKP